MSERSEESAFFPARQRVGTWTASIAIVIVLSAYAISVDQKMLRKLDLDEAQYLQVAWKLSQGQTLYRDFVEDHSPFLFLILERMVPVATDPAFPRLDILTLVRRARMLIVCFGVLGVACAATLAFRLTRSVLAPLIVFASLLGTEFTWQRAVSDVRNDPPALFMTWLGALLLLGRWRSATARSLAAGVAMGSVVTAVLWNPKWPVVSLVLGLFYLVRLYEARRSTAQIVYAVAPPIVIGASVLGIAASATSLRDYFFFTFQFNQLLNGWFARNPYMTARHFSGGEPFKWCGLPFKGLGPVLAVAMAVAFAGIASKMRLGPAEKRSLVPTLALVLAAVVEIRFIYAYPNLWVQYYLMWSFAVALLYGCVASSLIDLIGVAAGSRMRLTAEVAAVAIVTSLFFQGIAPRLRGPRGDDEAYWGFNSYVQRQLRPGETVWLDARLHPVGVPDASYYWFALNDLIPFSLDFTRQNAQQTFLPRLTERDLPVCRAMQGTDRWVRYVSGDEYIDSLPLNRDCLAAMIAQGRARRVRDIPVFDISHRLADSNNLAAEPAASHIEKEKVVEKRGESAPED